MSDGNFNTKLLGAGGFASGVRSGEARMKQKAMTAFKKVIEENCHLSDDEIQQLTATFKSCLD